MRRLSILFLLSIFLAACASPTPTAVPHPVTVQVGTLTAATASPASAATALSPTAAATASPAGAATAVTTAVPSAAATVGVTATAAVPAASATPPAAPINVGYAGGASASQAVLPELQDAGQRLGWTVQQVPGPGADGLTTLAQGGAQVVVANGADLEAATRAAAGAFPKIYFIGVNQAGQGATLPNLLTLGAAPTREDQLGFMDGVVGGYTTKAKILTAVGYTTDPIGLKYRNGFLHGVRLSCSKCRVDFVDLTDLSDSATAAQKAQMNASLSSDVVFVAAGTASAAALKSAAGAGALVAGIDGDIYQSVFGGGSVKGADKVLSSAYFDPGVAVVAAVKAYQTGLPWTGPQPYSAATGAIVLGPFRVSTDVLSDLDRSDTQATLGQLADGSLDTGIDLNTGNEQ